MLANGHRSVRVPASEQNSVGLPANGHPHLRHDLSAAAFVKEPKSCDLTIGPLSPGGLIANTSDHSDVERWTGRTPPRRADKHVTWARCQADLAWPSFGRAGFASRDRVLRNGPGFGLRRNQTVLRTLCAAAKGGGRRCPGTVSGHPKGNARMSQGDLAETPPRNFELRSLGCPLL